MSELKKIKEIFNFEKGSLQSTKCTPGDFVFVTASSEWKTHKEYSHATEALIVAVAASGSLGRCHYINDKFIASDLCFILTPKDPKKYPVDLKFYHQIFKTIKDDLVKKTATGTSKLAINKTNFGNYKIPYFDLDHQLHFKKILTNVNSKKDNLLENSSKQKELLSSLRQQILQDAISGKLTEKWRAENPDIESANQLLEKIKAKKEKLFAEKKIKKEKPLSPISEDKIPFELPEKWEWCRLGEIVINLRYGTSKKCNYSSSQNTVILRIPNISDGVLNLKDLKYTNLTKKEKNDLLLLEGDILLIRSNGSRNLVGKAVVVDSSCESFSYAGYLVRIRPLIEPWYLKNSLSSVYLRNQIEIPLRTTVGINNINSTEISNLVIPLPPRAEQKAIDAEVKKLTDYVSQLEEKITQDEKDSEMMMQAFLAEAFKK